MLAPLPPTEDTHHTRHTDFSNDPRYNEGYPAAAIGDAQCTTLPSRIQHWVIPAEETQAIFATRQGTPPNLIYARGVPNTPSPDTTSFHRKQYPVLVVYNLFCRDLGCVERSQRKPLSKYSLRIESLKNHRGKVEDLRLYRPRGHHPCENPREPHNHPDRRPQSYGAS